MVVQSYAYQYLGGCNKKCGCVCVFIFSFRYTALSFSREQAHRVRTPRVSDSSEQTEFTPEVGSCLHKRHYNVFYVFKKAQAALFLTKIQST